MKAKIVQSGDGKRASVLILDRTGLARAVSGAERGWRRRVCERERAPDLMGRQQGDPFEKARGIAT